MGEKNPFSGPIRRTQIPIYLDDVQRFRQETCPPVKKQEALCGIRKVLDENFNYAGQQVSSVYGKYYEDYRMVKDKINTGISHASVTLDYLRQEENDLPRVGAVAMAGMAGLVMGLRGGFLRKLVYTTVAASGMAGLCYPQHAVDLSKDLVLNSKKYASIGYNFIIGVKHSESTPSPTELPKLSPIVSIPKVPNKSQIKGDIGQSNPEDKDLYTTRT